MKHILIMILLAFWMIYPTFSQAFARKPTQKPIPKTTQTTTQQPTKKTIPATTKTPAQKPVVKQVLVKGDEINGVWLTDAKDTQVKVYRVGNFYYGRIIWMVNAKNAQGKALLDTKNPKSSSKSRPQVGIISLSHLVYQGGNTYGKGVMYYPTNGQTYNCNVTLMDKNHLKLRLFKGVTLLGKTTIFTRVS